MTLSEAKDAVAFEKFNCDYLTALFRRTNAEIAPLVDEAAELYARSKWVEAQDALLKSLAETFKKATPDKGITENQAQVFSTLSEMIKTYPKEEFK